MQYYRHYTTGLPFFLIPSISISCACGIIDVINDRDIIYPHHKCMNFMGIVSIGTFIGFAYPITMPYLAGRYLYRNRIV